MTPVPGHPRLRRCNGDALLDNLDEGDGTGDRRHVSGQPPAVPPSSVVPDAGPYLDVAIISINYHPEPTGISVYTTGTAEYLAAAGHTVTAFTGFSYYPGWSKQRQDQRRIYRTEHLAGVCVHRCYLYVPAQPSAMRRIAHEFSFVASVALRYLFSRRRPVTLIVSPPLALGLTLGVLAKLKRSRVVLHIQDLQPDAAIELGMLQAGRLTQLLFALERAGYRVADKISTISMAMRQHIESKGNFAGKTLLFKNWAGSDIVKPMSAPQSLKARWGLLDKFVVLYSGNMGVKQGLTSLLTAAERLQSDPDIVLVLVGDGGEKNALMAQVKALGLSNVRFEQPVAREDLGRLLAAADVSVITQKAGINDLVLPSKLANMLTSQRPVVVQAYAASELARIVAGSGCGLVVDPEDGDATAKAVLALKAQPVLAAEMASKGVVVAHQQFSQNVILEAFTKTLSMLSESTSTSHASRATRHPAP